MSNENEKKVNHKKRFYTQRAVCQCFKCGACNKRFFKCRKLIHYKEIDENRNLTETEIYHIFKVCNYGGNTADYYREYNRQGYRRGGESFNPEQTRTTDPVRPYAIDPQEMDEEEQAKK